MDFLHGLLIIVVCLNCIFVGLLCSAAALLLWDRKGRLQLQTDIVKVKQDFTDLLTTASKANVSQAEELVRIGDKVMAHDMMLRGGVTEQKAKR